MQEYIVEKVRLYIQGELERQNVSVSKLSELTDIPKTTIDNFLSGQTKSPAFDRICQMVSCLGGSLDGVVEMGSGQKGVTKTDSGEKIPNLGVAFPNLDDSSQNSESNLSVSESRFDAERCINVMESAHQREMDILLNANGETVRELKRSRAFWLGLSCVLIAFLAAIVVWFAWDILNPQKGIIRILQSLRPIGARS